MISRIQNCYDSHTHFLATGQIAAGLQLRDLKVSSDVAKLQIRPQHFRADWLTGFGWDQNSWPGAKLPAKADLDAVFRDFSVFFSRADGHASWLNTLAIEELKNLGFQFSQAEESSGILFEKSHFKALSLLPAFTNMQIENFFTTSQKIFNQAGFTHIRDLSMNLSQWKVLNEMQIRNGLSVCVDAFVTVGDLDDLDRVLQEIAEMKKTRNPYLKVHGVKFFADGSLGSKTAYLSEKYLGTESLGTLLWSPQNMKQLLQKTWGLGLDVAVHTIGDQAAHAVVQVARDVSAEGILGRLHLEHVEVLRPETVQFMKPLHVTCYLQPSHWLSDKEWLPKMISQNLLKHVFPWELLRKNKIPFYFGSDSPIEGASLLRSQQALKLSSQKGVPGLNEDWKKHHSHPDPKWTQSYTEFSDEKIIQVYFDGRPLL